VLVVGDGGGAWGSWSGGVSAAPVENKALPGIQVVLLDGVAGAVFGCDWGRTGERKDKIDESDS